MSYYSGNNQINPASQWYSAQGEPESPSAAYSSSAAYGNYNNNAYPTTGYNDQINPQQGGYEEDYDNELPLLEELGVRFDHIWAKTLAVIHPFKVISTFYFLFYHEFVMLY